MARLILKPLNNKWIHRQPDSSVLSMTKIHLVILGKTVWAEGQIGAGGGQFCPLGPRAVLPS